MIFTSIALDKCGYFLFGPPRRSGGRIFVDFGWFGSWVGFSSAGVERMHFRLLRASLTTYEIGLLCFFCFVLTKDSPFIEWDV